MVCKKSYFQNTIKKAISISGIGLFTGKKVKMTIFPALEDHGIVFKRLDLADKPVLQAKLEFVKETNNRTFVGFGKKSVQTVEHLLSSLAAFNIDNVIVEIDGSEIPIADGSSKIFADLIESAGIEKQTKLAKIYTLNESVSFVENQTHLIALPSDEYRISFALHHPNSELLKAQYYSYVVEKNSYVKDIAPSRTYSIYEEIKPLLDKNLIKGGNLDNAVVIKDNRIINSEGIRFPDEMVRHKILDMIGDLSLLGKRFLAHIIAVRSGHLTNIKFAKKLLPHLKECKNI